LTIAPQPTGRKSSKIHYILPNFNFISPIILLIYQKGKVKRERTMDLTLTEEQRSIQQLAHQFAQNHLAPFAKQWDQEEIFPIETFKAAAQLGFTGLFVEEEFGGASLNRFDGVLVFEQLSKGCVSTAAYLSIHNMVGGMIQRFGTAQQKQEWLPKLCSMSAFSSYCLTEPGSGSDAAALKTKAIREGDHYVLNGSKAFISGAGVSDIYLCMVRTGEEGPRGVSALLVEKGTPGLSFGKNEEKMGWRSQPTAMVQFDQCRVPVTNRLGDEGQGFKIAMTGLDGGRLNIAACSLGGAQYCLDAAATYAKERMQFGQKLADMQSIQFKLADMETELEAARLLTYQAALKFSRAEEGATKFCAMAKRLATDTGSKVVDQALQIHGGYGYIKDYHIERFCRDLRVHQILEGTNEIMRVIVARHLLK
jgi:alkylation response protein AidB-like acyl-CoA dehydrogenase